MKDKTAIGLAIAWSILAVFGFFYIAGLRASTLPATPNANLALEARVTVLEGQVKELRRVVGIDKGLKEGLQNRGTK